MVASPQEEKTFPAVAYQDSTGASLGLAGAGFLSFSQGDKLRIIRGGAEVRVWYGRREDTPQEGFIARADVMDQCDYYDNIIYGDICVSWGTPSRCGNTALDGFQLTSYCCAET